ncbi:hypothetical protein GTO91_04775 [Heliobacterium undosum]|uniref:NlpC/P60 domain-containing protein n=1 Tax=Heliomicrobium undosum TaxID=121734 RepID=A0A845L2G7_9FIRM|nr:C40 family peptidase [Heliomicrobium undosum]MZP29024.1 hypothetical protein [Heliomicrobium undosum]
MTMTPAQTWLTRICRPLADVWSDWAEGRERVTQGWLGSAVECLEQEQYQPGWRKVRLPDQKGYEGWMQAEDLSLIQFLRHEPLLETLREPWVVIVEPVVKLRQSGCAHCHLPDSESGLSLAEGELWLPMGARFPLLERRGGEVALRLPGGSLSDGALCWAPEDAVRLCQDQCNRQQAEEALHLAAKFSGRPYLWGGMGWPGIDCSGLVFIAFWTLGFGLPRDAQDQWAATAAIAEGDACPGDLIFFSSHPPQLDHVGMVAGERRFLHASGSLGGVCYSEWRESRWRDTLAGFRRVLR